MKKIMSVAGAAALGVTSLAGTAAIVAKGCIDVAAHMVDKGYKLNKDAYLAYSKEHSASEEKEKTFKDTLCTFLTYMPVVNVGISLYVMHEVTKMFDDVEEISPYLEPLTENEKIERAGLHNNFEKAMYFIEASGLTKEEMESCLAEEKGPTYIKLPTE